MALKLFNLGSFVGRLIKVIMVFLVVPLVLGLLFSILRQFEVVGVGAESLRYWLSCGFVTYVGIHVFLWRPVGLFRISRSIFSVLSVWLFGGQVASVEESNSGRGSKSGRGGKGDDSAVEGSTLVAFSPYVVPVYMVLICVLAWVLRNWINRAFLDAPITYLIGASMAFHWLMTADELQQQRSRWHVETYLLALGLVFALTLLIASACLPLAMAEFSFINMLSEALLRTKEIYAASFHRVFF